MHRDEYNSQPETPLKYISCVCGYTTPADKDGRALLKSHQGMCRKFKGIEEPDNNQEE